jgi:hypothetical protein
MHIMTSELFVLAMTAATAATWVVCVRPIVKNAFTAAALKSQPPPVQPANEVKPPSLPSSLAAGVPDTKAAYRAVPTQQQQQQQQPTADVMPLVPTAFGVDEFWREDSPLLGGQYHVLV